ncbi:MAG: MerR family transcriptional regulator [Bryobacteraceae bacterium]
MTVGQVAKRSGLRASAVRYYESIGLLRAVRVHGRRQFTEDAIARLTLISAAKDASFSLDEIRRILAGDRPDWRQAAIAKLKELDVAIARTAAQHAAVSRLLGCPCQTIAECASKTRELCSLNR